MKSETVYNFFFHPYAKEHSHITQALSTVTIAALSLLTAGSFLILFGALNLRDRNIAKHQAAPKMQMATTPILGTALGTDVAKVNQIKQKLAEQLGKFEMWAEKNDWIMFTPQHSHYDWWMFPISRPSRGFGDTYTVSKKEIDTLKQDPTFMAQYRRGVELVVRSWGWDLAGRCPVPASKLTPDQHWSGYGVRLGKMADSLLLFDEIALYKDLQQFYQQVCYPQHHLLPLEPWVHQALSQVR
jgi:hypothetical protein